MLIHMKEFNESKSTNFGVNNLWISTSLNEFIAFLNLKIDTRKQNSKYRPLVIKDGEKTSSDRFNEFNHI
jgi:hypothetical protein